MELLSVGDPIVTWNMIKLQHIGECKAHLKTQFWSWIRPKMHFLGISKRGQGPSGSSGRQTKNIEERKNTCKSNGETL